MFMRFHKLRLQVSNLLIKVIRLFYFRNAVFDLLRTPDGQILFSHPYIVVIEVGMDIDDRPAAILDQLQHLFFIFYWEIDGVGRRVI